MIKFRFFVPILIISVINNVNCDNPEDVKRFGLERARQRYRFNHPPAVEDEDIQIPVSIVYDKVIDRSNRRQKLIQQAADSESEVSSPDIKNTNITPNDPKNIPEEKGATESDVLTKPESRKIKLSYKVPVAVVYDDDEPVKSYKNTLSSSRTDTTLRKSIKRRRKPTTESNDQTGVTVIPTSKNRQNDEKPANHTLEEALLKNSLEETRKIDLNRAKTRGQRRRRPQTRKTESNTEIKLKTTTINYQEQKYEQTTQSISSRINTENYETTTENRKTEPQNIKLPTINHDASKNVQRVDDSISKRTKANEFTEKREHGDPDPIVPIVASENLVFGNTGDFKYSYESGDGTIAFSNGKLKTSDYDKEQAGEAVEGGFSYKDKEGNDFSLSYTADENGYRPVGAHLPTPPPIPPAIARALAYLATKPTPEPVTESLDEQKEDTQAPYETS
ncbi:hypothetical protein O0L34_g16322 [Tuta absoluta]|nr:hypothetical protein O0L34_g16322 [Tuta absoluta]